MKFKEKLQSRKYQLVVLIIILATLGAFIPPIVNLILGTSLKILGGAEWVTVISLVISAYLGANVWQNRAEITQEITDKNITIIKEENSGVSNSETFSNKEDGEV